MLQPLADASELDRRRRSKRRQLNDEHPGPGRRHRSTPRDRPVGEQADGAQESGAVPSIGRMVQMTARRYRSGPMTSRSSAVRRSRRLVTALFVALLAFTGTVAVVSWPRATPVPVSAALPNAEGTTPASAPSAESPAPSREIAGGGAELPARRRRTRVPSPRSCPRPPRPRRRLRARGPRGARPKAPVAPQQAPLEVRDPGRLGDDHPRRRDHLDRDQRIRKRAQEDPRQGRHGLRARERQQDLHVGPDHGPRQRGQADLDTRVSTILPKVRIAGKATVRQLLDHTSGLPDYFLNGKIDRALFGDRAREWTTRDSFRYVGKPIFPAGKGWYYSNTNYALLALIAEAVDDRPLSEQLRSRFLGPTRAGPHLRTDRRAPRGPDRARLPGHGFREPARLHRPVRRQQGHALHFRRDRGPGRWFDGSLVHGRRALGTGALRRRGPAPATVRAMVADAQHSPLPTAGRLRAGRPGDDARRPTGAGSFGPTGRLPVARAPPAG